MLVPVCGIAGKVTVDGRVDSALLHRMCEVIRHRGPDSRGTFTRDGAGLGVQRLAIIDLHGGDQPIFNEDESVVVVLNGEIYNYRELRVELERAGHRFRTRTDTEVLVHLYEDLGDECVQRLRGMFAFALWDRRRRRLLIARDRLGKKPLWYSHRDGTLWFGSEAKSILQDPEVPRTVDYDAVDAFLHFGFVPDPLSTFEALHKLPPAHTLTWEDGAVEVRRYWRLSYTPKLAYQRREEVHELILDALLEATRLRLRSDVPLGAFLSGGVDSTAVVAAMAMQSAGTVKTFSIGFDVDSFDETAYAREVAELFGTEHTELRVDPSAVDVLPRLVWHYGEPFADDSAIPTLHLAEAAREHVTVALNGDGGDESFAGYRRYFFGTTAARLRWVPPPLARGFRAFAGALAGDPPRFAPARRARVLANAVALETDDFYTSMHLRLTDRQREELYSDDLLAELARRGGRSAPRIFPEALADSDALTTLDLLLDADVHTFLPSALLVKVDIASMAHSLEVRSPLLDHEFAELAARLPPEFKLRGTTGKAGLKDALRRWVPDHLLDRPKQGFSVPLADWLRGELRDLPGDVLLDSRARERGLFRESTVRSLIEGHLDGSVDNSSRLWPLMQVELWLRTYIDGPTPAPVALNLASSA
jgi:asparagine synthase (glutamine-hydrolysing)